ncbi:GntR family transcriptional regulator [Actinomadura terrae]|uniref:GntR family transcriptional regulator n=1 Tax=Actinomadura terrae TaxID=604353 RepID=UPI001FA7E996|nr:GntR family transcriptional regulator [Actinomadura terrae]
MRARIGQPIHIRRPTAQETSLELSLRRHGRPDPLYQQVVDAIEDQIAKGELGPDDKVPSAKVISETFNVANMTAQRALRELQQRGVAGRGSFVRPDAVTRLAKTAQPITVDAQYRAAMNDLREASRQVNAAFEEAVASTRSSKPAATSTTTGAPNTPRSSNSPCTATASAKPDARSKASSTRTESS